MVDSEQLGPKEDERREKINRRLVIFGILVVLLSFAWHVGSAFFLEKFAVNPDPKGMPGFETSIHDAFPMRCQRRPGKNAC